MTKNTPRPLSIKIPEGFEVLDGYVLPKKELLERKNVRVTILSNISSEPWPSKPIDRLAVTKTEPMQYMYLTEDVLFDEEFEKHSWEVCHLSNSIPVFPMNARFHVCKVGNDKGSTIFAVDLYLDSKDSVRTEPDPVRTETTLTYKYIPLDEESKPGTEPEAENPEEDLETLLKSIKKIQKILSKEPFNNIVESIELTGDCVWLSANVEAEIDGPSFTCPTNKKLRKALESILYLKSLIE